MDTFAESLAARIRARPAFWADFEAISSVAIGQFFRGTEVPAGDHGDREGAVRRLLQSASVFSQTPVDSDRALAQDVAIYSALISQDSASKACARDILVDVGNHPGADRLRSQMEIGDGPFTGYLRNSLLRSLNTVQIAGESRILTDFQRRVWSLLPNSDATAVSAPTSAGKSFVVLEYLCQQAIATPGFTAAFLAPTRALLSEIHGRLSQRLHEHSTTTRISTIPTLDPDNKPKQIFVLTQERLQVLLATWDGSFDLMIVDEAQAIGDESRGMILQDCLENVRSRSAKTRFLFLAPGATGFDSLCQAINVDQISVVETELSPVVQNRIAVDPVLGDENRLKLTLLAENRVIPVGNYLSERGFGHAQTRLAGIALELGNHGGSLVYGTGPAEAERIGGQIASDLPEGQSLKLKELSEFIGKHVHKKYSLARHVLKGVGFHYGKMPSLLREALEEAFKAGQLKYLVCTTTLFQGVNLPARNVFIDTPTRGKGDDLDAASLWNFAGRAGRLGHDIVGNVFLVGYGTWESKPLSERARFAITPAFRRTVVANRPEILAQLRNEPKEQNPLTPYSAVDAAAGLLISRAARGTLPAFIERTVGNALNSAEKAELIDLANTSFAGLGLPLEAVVINWTVNPFGQARLLARFREVIKEGKGDELMPLHPAGNVYQCYVQIFSRINKYILGAKPSRKYANLLTSTSLAWMRGKPLPQIIEEKIKYAQKSGTVNVNIDTKVREVFAFVEDILRFKYVQLGRAYVDLLRYAYKEGDQPDQARGVYDFPLALELGVSSAAGQAFIELGLSRISAASLEALIPDSKPSVERAREWLGGLKTGDFKLSRVIWDELQRKGLVSSAA